MPTGHYKRTPDMYDSRRGRKNTENLKKARLAQTPEWREKFWTPEKRAEVAKKTAESWTEERRQKQSARRRGKRRDSITVAAGFYIDQHGYKYLTGQQEHPLASGNGTVQEARKVLYDEIGEGFHFCHWDCGNLLEWGGVSGIEADHLDGDSSNNQINNLVPACHRCNFCRALAGNPIDWVADGLPPPKQGELA